MVRVVPRGGGIESMFSLFFAPPLNGELDECSEVLCGDTWLTWEAGALRTMLRLDDAVLMGLRGEARRGSEDDGIWFSSASGSW